MSNEKLMGILTDIQLRLTALELRNTQKENGISQRFPVLTDVDLNDMATTLDSDAGIKLDTEFDWSTRRKNLSDL